jgi:hypothetical protein
MDKYVNILCTIGFVMILIGLFYIFSEYELLGFAIQNILFWSGFILTLPKVILFAKKKETKGILAAIAYCFILFVIGYILFFGQIKIGCPAPSANTNNFISLY